MTQETVKKAGRKKGCIPWNKGIQWIENRGVNHPLFGKHWKWTEEQKLKLQGLKSKEKHPKWIKDRSLVKKEENKHLDTEYKQWRKQVWLRDNFKCKIANPDCQGRIEAHHILGWSSHPELRYQINNGITLCHAHHPRKRKDEAELSPYFQSLVAEMK